ncbi:unnamed protein product, partial [Staurois parvus]
CPKFSGHCPVLWSAVSGHILRHVCPVSLCVILLYCVHSLWSSHVLCPQSFSGHLLYCVCSLWSIPCTSVRSPLVISCYMSAVFGHLLYYVRSLWSSPVLCPQLLWSSVVMSAVSVYLL